MNNANELNDAIDIKEVVCEIDGAATLLGQAEETFWDLGAVFEAIAASAEPGSLPSRLAKMGKSLCEDRASEFCGYKENCQSHFERYKDAAKELA